MAILAALLLAAAAYVHVRIPSFTKAGIRVLVTHVLLLLTGAGFGLLSTAYVAGRAPQVLAFLVGFGLVHVPAAVILFVKSRRGSGQS